MKQPKQTGIKHPGRNRFAYALYATDVHYGTAALVTLRRLKELTTRDDLDFVVLHPGLPRYLVKAMRGMGAITFKVARLRYTSGHYFKDCLIKLRIFQLTQYERIVYLDVDTLPMKSLDSLFTLPFKETIAAPRAYWLPQHQVTSLLMVIKPSIENWDRVKQHFKSAAYNNYYDMEIINLEFKNEIHYLPDSYACLNSEWEDRHSPFYFGSPAQTLNKAQIVHFTALGKPWYFSLQNARRYRPDAHQTFHALWGEWWSVRDEIICKSKPLTRLMLMLLKVWSRRELITLMRHLRRKLTTHR